MLKTTIKKAFENYKKDLGLGRILAVIAFFNLFIFFFVFISYKYLLLQSLIPIILGLSFYYFKDEIIKRGPLIVFFANIGLVVCFAVLNYFLIGTIDSIAGELPRYDQVLSSIDVFLFNRPVADVIYLKTKVFGKYQPFFYDLVQFSYMVYFFLPLLAGHLYWSKLPHKYKHLMGRMLASYTLYFTINFLFYLVVPVSGPQDYIPGLFHEEELPLTDFGKSMHLIVKDARTTFIDCFPSGHTGVALLSTIWLYKIQHPLKKASAILAILIVLATLSLRYHYLTDVIAAIPLAIFCYRFSEKIIPSRIYQNKL